MKEEKISKAYAKSIYQLGKEKGIDVADELTKLTEVINTSNDLETVLFSELFTTDEKSSVLKEITTNLKLSPLVNNSLSFLLAEKRIGILPMIFKDIVVLDDDAKGFLRGTIEGSDANIDDSFRTKITSYLEGKMGKKTQLDYMKNDEITAGYRITVGDLQLDASLDNQLNKFKETVLN